MERRLLDKQKIIKKIKNMTLKILLTIGNSKFTEIFRRGRVRSRFRVQELIAMKAFCPIYGKEQEEIEELKIKERGRAIERAVLWSI